MRRHLAIDLPLGLAVAVGAFGAARFGSWGRQPWAGPNGPHGPGGPDGSRPPWGDADLLTPVSPWLVPVLLLMAAGIAIRRQRPRLAFVLVAVGGGGYLALGHPYPPVMVGLALTGYAMAVASPAEHWWPVSLVVVPMLAAAVWPGPSVLAAPEFSAGVLGVLGVTGASLAIGTVRRTRREALAAAQQLQSRRAAYVERLRVARDVHDVVGHSLSVISMQAGVALHVAERRPDQVVAALQAIRDTSTAALTDLRTTLDTLRDPEAGAGDETRAPHAGLAQLDDLVGALRAAGRTVTVTRTGADVVLPAAVDQAAFRIAQESLTNVIRHAGTADATVAIDLDVDRVLVRVADGGPGRRGTGEGSGIAGMRERARALGGRLTAGNGPSGGFVVQAELPLGAAR